MNTDPDHTPDLAPNDASASPGGAGSQSGVVGASSGVESVAAGPSSSAGDARESANESGAEPSVVATSAASDGASVRGMRRFVLVGVLGAVLIAACTAVGIGVQQNTAGAPHAASEGESVSDGSVADAEEPAAGSSSDEQQAPDERNATGDADDDASAEPRRDPEDPFPELPPIPVGEGSDAENDLVFVVSNVERITGEAQGLGEISGPAIRVTVEVSNVGDSTKQLSSIAVNAFMGDERIPAGELTGSGAEPFVEDLKAGTGATGTFVFSTPEGSPDPVYLSLDTDPSQPLIVVDLSERARPNS